MYQQDILVTAHLDGRPPVTKVASVDDYWLHVPEKTFGVFEIDIESASGRISNENSRSNPLDEYPKGQSDQ